MAVLLYHFWPERLPGGYVGVDIFFVISGFLITAHLLSKPPTTLGMLKDFWGKRIRRLLPAATVVLVAILAASLIWLPSTMIPTVAKEVAAAAIYGENWMLASTATDYLASEDAPSPVQHYWSLSVEEQYYIVWPALIGLLFLLGRRFLSGKKLVAVAVALIFSSSLAWSVYLTATDAASAYFVTTTRAWELALGGIVALVSMSRWLPNGEMAKRILSWLGIGMMGAAILLFNDQTPFPSYTALLPTLGAALVIFAVADTVAWSPRRILGWKPVQFLGDISYSLYLWHWPVVVIVPYVLSGEFSWPLKLLAIAVTIGLAVLTKYFVEDPVRRSQHLSLNLRKTYAYGFASVVFSLGLGIGVLQWSQGADARAASALERVMTQNAPCLGADALRNDDCNEQDKNLYMTPSFAKKDKAVLYKDNCWAMRPFTSRQVCTYGKKDADIKIALIGNSHAGMWHSAIARAAEENGWRLDTYLISECYTIMRPLAFSTSKNRDNCVAWNKWAVGTIASKDYSVVVMANRTYAGIHGEPKEARDKIAKTEYEKTIRSFLNAKQQVLIIRDAPEGGSNVPDCLARNENDVTKCDSKRSKVLKYDPLYAAAQKLKNAGVRSLDLSHLMCDEEKCYATLGGLIVYFDHGHLTNTFAKTLTPEISKALKEAVGER